MASSIRVDTDFRSSRDRASGKLGRALPHRQSYLGFVLGLFATVVVALGGLGWWLVRSGVVTIQINL